MMGGMISCANDCDSANSNQDEHEGLCERYDINIGRWQSRSRLLIGRSFNTHCALGDYIYSFFGWWADDEYGRRQDSIEFLNAQDDISGPFAYWAMLDFDNEGDSFVSRLHPVIVPISDTEILICGGKGDSDDIYDDPCYSDAYILDVEGKSIKLVSSELKLKGSKFAFLSFQNGCRVWESDKIVFLAESPNLLTEDVKMQLVTYKRGDQEASCLFEDSPVREGKDYELSQCTIF